MSRIYKFLAYTVFNTLVLLVVLNGIAGFAYYVLDQVYQSTEQEYRTDSSGSKQYFTEDGAPVDNGKRNEYQKKWFDYTAVSTYDPKFYAEILDDFYELNDRGFVYEPWVQFSEPLFQGRHATVQADERGFARRKTLNPDQPRENSSIRVFILGGSTTFGYHVADEHTWPSFLSSILNESIRQQGERDISVVVSNYGRAYYDTSQELVLLIDLLKNGHRPQIVLFMDGVNLGSEQDVPAFTNKYKKLGDLAQHESPQFALQHLHGTINTYIPLARFFRAMKHSIAVEDESAILTAENELQKQTKKGIQFLAGSGPDQETSRESCDYLLNRFRQNRRLITEICKIYDLNPFFFIQPDPVIDYPTSLYRNYAFSEKIINTKQVRSWLHEQLKCDSDVIYLGQLFQAFGLERNHKAIVDDCHYTPEFNRFLAEHVSQYLIEDVLKSRIEAETHVPATGIKRKLREPRHAPR